MCVQAEGWPDSDSANRVLRLIRYISGSLKVGDNGQLLDDLAGKTTA